MDTDILIVGAGPTGLMLANQLGRRGIRATIIDRHSGPAQQTRAMGVQARTLEIYAKLGIAKQAIELGANTSGINLWAEAKHKARVPVGAAGKGLSPFPFVLMLGQDDNERIMGDKLREWDVSVQWNTELLSLEQQDDGVKVQLQNADGSMRTLKAAWVAGCDGSRSAVRELNHIDFPGAPYEHVFFVADTVATGNMVPQELNGYLWTKGFHLFFPMHGKDRWRVIGILPAALSDREHLTFEDVIPHIQKEAGTNLAFRACHWFSTYRIQHRCAERFREGRCFLLGDAAHIHSPMGGQGMNTGLQDAYNLAWKLAFVIQGRAGEELLDSYAAERMPVAHALLRGTDRAFGLVVSDTALAAFFRTQIMANIARIAMRFERVQRLAFRTISQIGIRYRASPLSRTQEQLPKDAPHAGDRFPWLRLKFSSDGVAEDLFERFDDKRFNLIAIGQSASSKRLGDMVDVHTVPADPINDRELARAHIAGTCYYLLRPDGHVGLAGSHLEIEAIMRYLSDQHIQAEPNASKAARPAQTQPNARMARTTSSGVSLDRKWPAEGTTLRS